MTTITRFQAENYKRLRAVEIIPGEGANLVPILGENMQGKSSVLDAIMAALGGKSYMPSRPVRKGEDEGAIRLELSNGLVVRRTFDTAGGGSIIVESAEGARFPSPQAVLDKLYSSVAFDPIAFTRLKPADQLDTLRRLVKLEVDVDALAAANDADYKERTDVNREVKRLQAQVDGFAEIPDAPDSPDLVNEDEILELINGASEANGNIERRRLQREAFVTALEGDKARADEIEKKIKEWQDELELLRVDVAEKQKQVDDAKPLPDPVDTAELTIRLRQAQGHNAKVRTIQERGRIISQLQEQQEKSAELSDAMMAREGERLKAFQMAKMPVDGLSFGAGEVLLNELPFEQASTAEQLRVSTAIGMAGNPDLRVMLVRDASLLDGKGYELLATMAEEGNFQFWVEAVDDGNKVGIIMEDGAVRGAPEPAPIEKSKKRATKKKDEDDGQANGAVGPDEAPAPHSDEAGAGPGSDAGAGDQAASDVQSGPSDPPAVLEPAPKPAAPKAVSLFDDED